jgi:hypothetical protein
MMEDERSPIIDIMGDTSKAPLSEALMASSSSNASSRGAASDTAEVEAKDVMDLREHAQSYDFGVSSVIVGHIRQLETLRYFVDGSAHEPGEETLLEPNTDEVVVFEEFFVAGMRMPPHPALIEILLMFWVQPHQLTLNAIAQLSKYFLAVLSFSGELSSDGFVKRYELHYQLNKVAVDGFEKFEQFSIINFHAK